MINIANIVICNHNLNYMFYLEFSVHVSVVKQAIAVEEMLFSLPGRLHGGRCYSLQGFV
jgi:hypothetical protein